MEFPLLPSGESLPLPYRWVRAHGLHSLTPWHFEEFSNDASVKYKEKYGIEAWPFACHQARMETAAFSLSDGKANGQVVVLDNDTLDRWGQSDGTSIQEYATFWDWFADALVESREFMSEEWLSAVLDE